MPINISTPDEGSQVKFSPHDEGVEITVIQQTKYQRRKANLIIDFESIPSLLQEVHNAILGEPVRFESKSEASYGFESLVLDDEHNSFGACEYKFRFFPLDFGGCLIRVNVVMLDGGKRSELKRVDTDIPCQHMKLTELKEFLKGLI